MDDYLWEDDIALTQEVTAQLAITESQAYSSQELLEPVIVDDFSDSTKKQRSVATGVIENGPSSPPSKIPHYDASTSKTSINSDVNNKNDNDSDGVFLVPKGIPSSRQSNVTIQSNVPQLDSAVNNSSGHSLFTGYSAKDAAFERQIKELRSQVKSLTGESMAYRDQLKELQKDRYTRDGEVAMLKSSVQQKDRQLMKERTDHRSEIDKIRKSANLQQETSQREIERLKVDLEFNRHELDEVKGREQQLYYENNDEISNASTAFESPISATQINHVKPVLPSVSRKHSPSRINAAVSDNSTFSSVHSFKSPIGVSPARSKSRQPLPSQQSFVNKTVSTQPVGGNFDEFATASQDINKILVPPIEMVSKETETDLNLPSRENDEEYVLSHGLSEITDIDVGPRNAACCSSSDLIQDLIRICKVTEERVIERKKREDSIEIQMKRRQEEQNEIENTRCELDSVDSEDVTLLEIEDHVENDEEQDEEINELDNTFILNQKNNTFTDSLQLGPINVGILLEDSNSCISYIKDSSLLFAEKNQAHHLLPSKVKKAIVNIFLILQSYIEAYIEDCTKEVIDVDLFVPSVSSASKPKVERFCHHITFSSYKNIQSALNVLNRLISTCAVIAGDLFSVDDESRNGLVVESAFTDSSNNKTEQDGLVGIIDDDDDKIDKVDFLRLLKCVCELTDISVRGNNCHFSLTIYSTSVATLNSFFLIHDDSLLRSLMKFFFGKYGFKSLNIVTHIFSQAKNSILKELFISEEVIDNLIITFNFLKEMALCFQDISSSGLSVKTAYCDAINNNECFFIFISDFILLVHQHILSLIKYTSNYSNICINFNNVVVDWFICLNSSFSNGLTDLLYAPGDSSYEQQKPCHCFNVLFSSFIVTFYDYLSIHERSLLRIISQTNGIHHEKVDNCNAKSSVWLTIKSCVFILSGVQRFFEIKSATTKENEFFKCRTKVENEYVSLITLLAKFQMANPSILPTSDLLALSDFVENPEEILYCNVIVRRDIKNDGNDDTTMICNEDSGKISNHRKTEQIDSGISLAVANDDADAMDTN